jgi:Putative metal-binding motif
VNRAGIKAVVVAAIVALGGLSSLSCSVNEYCVNCASNDGGHGDGNDLPDAIFDSSTGGPDACVPDGTEICDGKDNDCDGKVDEDTATEPLPKVGEDCSSNVGECTAGKYSCTAGNLVCSGKTPQPEVCDNKDNNCDGTADNGDPGGGAVCGTDMGECISGFEHCVGGAVVCVGDVKGQPEQCDGKDNDCDGMFDEDLPPLGSCGPTQGNTGECQLGVLMCGGGQPQCVGAIFPTFELCDNLDQDCDGNPTNGYDLVNDARNCGMCGHVCSVPHATAKCAASKCAVGSCDPGFFDIDKDPANGCEYQCDFQGPTEACNGVDDNCNGTIDENLTVPDMCNKLGECAGTVATCHGLGGFTCDYGPTVSTDSSGKIVPEASCDGKDNDCNGVKDDPFKAQLGAQCFDTGKGICQGKGSNVCNATKDGITCNITTPGQTATAESCNGLDDDCDGTVDNGAASGNLPGQNWVTMATGHQIMQYEAARPDAKAADQGTAASLPCSKAGVQPWTDVTAPQAAAACASISAHLCSEEEWQRACAVVTPTSYPVVEPGTNNGQIYFEAEDFSASVIATSTGTGAATRAWEPDYTAGFSGMMGLRANPDVGANLTLANTLAQAPRLEYRVQFTTTGNHYVWVKMSSYNNSGNTIGVGIVSNSTTANTPTQTLTSPINDSSWNWVRTNAINVTATGVGLVEVYMREDGIKVDAVLVTQSNSATAPTLTTGPGNTWAYNATPSTYQPNACNGLDFDTNSGTAGNQDDIVATGSLSTCDANWGAAGKIFDLTGNVQEWTQPRVPGINPIRGGSSNDIQGGLACALSFGAADDAFFFPNLGFRCCR